jgi:hypothetical protein
MSVFVNIRILTIIQFQYCLGAIDGTHLMARVTNHNDLPFRGKSSTPTQNVMCMTNFDLCFTFVCSGWEGSAHDARIFTETINDPTMNFPTPEEGTVSSIIVFLGLIVYYFDNGILTTIGKHVICRILLFGGFSLWLLQGFLAPIST